MLGETVSKVVASVQGRAERAILNGDHNPPLTLTIAQSSIVRLWLGCVADGVLVSGKSHLDKLAVARKPARPLQGLVAEVQQPYSNPVDH